MESIFYESNETLGLLYNRYYKLPNKIKQFMAEIDRVITSIKKNGINDQDDMDEQLMDKLHTFKSEVEIDTKSPEAVDIKSVKKMRTDLKSIKSDTLSLLTNLGKLRQKNKYGDNVLKGIVVKPKVFSKSIEEKDFYNRNKIIRSISRSMDWVEKIILDVMNLADQDLNLLTLIDRVYYHILYESIEESMDLLQEEIDWENDSAYKPFYLGEEGAEDSPSDDILSMKVGNEDEAYYPVFSILVSYDMDKYDTATDAQKGCIARGKKISRLTHGDQFTHALISFDTSMEHLYHFIGPGFLMDNIYKNPSFEITKAIYINVTFLTKEEKDVVLNEVKRYKTEQDDTSYSVMHLVNLFTGKTKHQDKRQICSTFVAYLLSNGNLKNIHKDYSIIRPEDITILPRSFYVITFKDLEDFKERRTEFDARLKRIYDDNIDEIREYNNILPKVVIKEQYKKKGSIDGIIDWFMKRIFKDQANDLQ